MSRLPKGADANTAKLAEQGILEKKGAAYFVQLSEPSKSAFKAVVAVLEQPKAIGLLTELAKMAGIEDIHAQPIKLILRRAGRREADARERINPIVRNNPFVCAHCAFPVPPLERGERNHCPRCLHSRHVDATVPGDRRSDCGGLMVAENLEVQGGVHRVTHRCLSCGFRRRNRLFPDRNPEPDQIDILLRGKKKG